MHRRAYRGTEPFSDWLAGWEQGSLLSAPATYPQVPMTKVINVALEVIAERRFDDWTDLREEIKTRCATRQIFYDSASVELAIRDARGKRNR